MALDAAVTALLARHTEISQRHGRYDLRASAMSYYNKGLLALRVTLDDDRMVATAETLCAVMLLAYCQVILNHVAKFVRATGDSDKFFLLLGTNR